MKNYPHWGAFSRRIFLRRTLPVLAALLLFSAACHGQTPSFVADSKSWVVVIGAVKECPQFNYRILDAQHLKNRDEVELAGALMSDLRGLTEQEIQIKLQGMADLSAEIIPESLRVLVYKVALPPKVIERIMVQARLDGASDCRDPQWRQEPLPGNYRGDGPDDISITAAKATT